MYQAIFLLFLSLFPLLALAGEPDQFPAIAGSFSWDDYKKHFAPNEPMYILTGWMRPQLKFQVSFRYLFFNPSGSLAQKHPWVTGFNFGLSQTGLMDITTLDESFFYDISHRPELFYYFERLGNWPVGLQFGIGHESNGFREPYHKSINILFLRPIATFEHAKSRLFLMVAPKLYYYFGPISLNHDIANYRGYCDLRLLGGWRDGVQLSAMGRLGSDLNKASLELTLSYSLSKLTGDNFDAMLTAQYFLGYGETLLSYKDTTNMLRFGLSLVR